MKSILVVLVSVMFWSCTPNGDIATIEDSAPDVSAEYVANNPHCTKLCDQVAFCDNSQLGWLCDPQQCRDSKLVCLYDGTTECDQEDDQIIMAHVVIALCAGDTVWEDQELFCSSIDMQLRMAGI